MRYPVKTLNLDLGEHSYSIHIGQGLINDATLINHKQRSVIVTDKVIAPLYLHQLEKSIPRQDTETIIISTGEEQKSLSSFEMICTQLLEKTISRQDKLIALGGGVIGDLTGFVAASYHRGIDFVQVPTTLLAQVDSSIGGKTAVNHPLGKNMIGAFHQPQVVIIDLDTLKTLPARQIVAGIAEIIKAALITDTPFFSWLEDNIDALKNLENEALSYAIYHACRIKSEIVALDAHEISGHRMLLNLGHTFAHAIETASGYGAWLHGEAVGCGIALAVQLSTQKHYISKSDASRIIQLLQRAGLPTRIPEALNTDQLMQLMQRDKKNTSEKLRLVLLKAIGDAFVTDNISVMELNEFMQTVRQHHHVI